MIIDGRALAKEILASVREEVGTLARPLVVRAVVVAPTPATESYLRIKEARAKEVGIELQTTRLLDDATTEEVIREVQAPGADAIIVQLPLPSHIETRAVLDAIPTSKDADVLSTNAYELFLSGAGEALLPPVVLAVQAIFERANVSPLTKKMVVVGQGRLVGDPVTKWLSRFGAVEVITEETKDISPLKDADIIISGAGKARLITPALIKEGVVLIDAGTSESGGTIVGDADPACSEVASVFTPVPGGVGPVVVACLFKNIVALSRT